MDALEFINKVQEGVLLNDYTLKDVEWLMTEFAKHKEQLRLCGVGVPKGTLCECGGNERVALDCTRKPCEHPQYFNL